MRRCTQRSPVARQSSHPATSPSGSRSSTLSRWVHSDEATDVMVCRAMRAPHSRLLALMRYGVPALLLVAGLVVLVVPGDSQAEGFALFAGAAVSILLLNVLYRYGVRGDEERDREEEARAYFDEHGEWPPDEERPAGRAWSLPINVAMPPDDERRDEPADR